LVSWNCNVLSKTTRAPATILTIPALVSNDLVSDAIKANDAAVAFMIRIGINVA
jgi:hypothetical protein